jgi:hypothetical protein
VRRYLIMLHLGDHWYDGGFHEFTDHLRPGDTETFDNDLWTVEEVESTDSGPVVTLAKLSR